jgi:hypothetical protein
MIRFYCVQDWEKRLEQRLGIFDKLGKDRKRLRQLYSIFYALFNCVNSATAFQMDREKQRTSL